jgi:hypothetical protein
MEKAGHSWNNWSAAGKANKAIKKTLSSIYREDLSLDDEVYDRELDWWGRMPNVPAITGLLLRQQTRRRCIPITLAEMVTLLPRLEEVIYEPWRLPNRGSLVSTDKANFRNKPP